MRGSDTGAVPAGRVVAASCLICLVLGSVHGFSVFLVPLETTFGVGRGAASLSYSLALVSLTGAVLLGPRLTLGWTGPGVMGLVGAMGALGLVICAVSGAIWGVWVGFGGLFGAANGLGYGYGLQAAGRAWPKRAAWAMGLVTASYALGATLAPIGFHQALAIGGLGAAFGGLAGIVALAAAGAAGLWHGAPREVATSSASGQLPSAGALLRLWIAYGAGVGAGLMVIGHTAGIVAAAEIQLPHWVAPSVVAAANMFGSLAGGRVADRWSEGLILTLLALCCAVVLGIMALGPPGVVIPGLALVGGLYGATIAITPAMIARRFGMASSALVYGRVFTAWGAAGLLAPWVAGLWFERMGHYGAALWLAAGLSALAAIVMVWDLRQGSDRTQG